MKERVGYFSYEDDPGGQQSSLSKALLSGYHDHDSFFTVGQVRHACTVSQALCVVEGVSHCTHMGWSPITQVSAVTNSRFLCCQLLMDHLLAAK